MSLILDALNKRDREQQPARDIPDLKAGPTRVSSVERPRRDPVLLGIGALLVALLAVLIGVLIWRSDPARPEPPAVAVTAPAAPAEGSQRANLREPVRDWKPLDQVPARRAPAATEADIAALYSTAPESEVDVEAPELLVIEPETPPQERRSAASERRRDEMAEAWQGLQTQALPEQLQARPTPKPQSQPQLPPPPSPAAPAPVPSAPPAGDPANGESLASLGDVPYLHELSVQIQNQIPSLMYNRHNFAEGNVILNKKTWQEGDTPAAGVSIERILSDGIVLNFDGRSFKLDALSSWVNR